MGRFLTSLGAPAAATLPLPQKEKVQKIASQKESEGTGRDRKGSEGIVRDRKGSHLAAKGVGPIDCEALGRREWQCAARHHEGSEGAHDGGGRRQLAEVLEPARREGGVAGGTVL